MRGSSVLVLDDVPQTLAVIRSLGRAGYHVVLGKNNEVKNRSSTEYSRYCHEIWRHPPVESPEFSQSIRQLISERPDVRSIFPVGETGANVLLRIPEIRAANIHIAMVTERLFLDCRDKGRANQLAQAAGLAVPLTRIVGEFESLRGATREVHFPCIVKSVRTEARVFGRKAYVIKDGAEFDSVFSHWPEGLRELMVQAYIPGPLRSADYVAAGGVLTGYCEVDVLRTDMEDGTGFGVDFVTLPPRPEVLRATQAFVACHGYSGPGLIQFIQSVSTGELFFIENNPRLSAGISHPIQAGVDCPLLALEAAQGLPLDAPKRFDPQQTPYTIQRAYWLSRDISGLLNRRSTLSATDVMRWLLAVIRSLWAADGHIIWQWRDPLPGLHVGCLLMQRLLVGTLLSKRTPNASSS